VLLSYCRKATPEKGGHLGNGAVGGGTLLVGLGVFGSPNELDVVFEKSERYGACIRINVH
jgi:hypothetical protein